MPRPDGSSKYMHSRTRLSSDLPSPHHDRSSNDAVDTQSCVARGKTSPPSETGESNRSQPAQPCCCCWLRQSELYTLSYASASLSQESAILHYPDLKPGGFGTAVRPDEEHRGPYLHVFSRSGTRAGVVADAPIRRMSWVDIDSRLSSRN